MPPPTTADDYIPNFNTGAMRDRLTEVGVTDQTATATVDVIVDAQSALATRADLKAEIKSVRTDLKAEIKTVRAEIKTTKTELKLWVSLHTITILAAFFADRFFA